MNVTETAQTVWGYIAAFAGSVALLVALSANMKKILNVIKKRLQSRKERREMPLKTLEAVNSLKNTVDGLSDKVKDLDNKMNGVDGKVENLTQKVEDLRTETDSQSEMLKSLDGDTADLLSSQLTREHDYFVKLGYCPTVDKQRIGKIHERYINRGRNHISDRLMDDIMDLPISPEAYGQQ